ncbi:MAG: hypothetical protein U1D55_19030 [Phycisphaerae bacterium]
MKRFVVGFLASTLTLAALTGCPFPAADSGLDSGQDAAQVGDSNTGNAGNNGSNGNNNSSNGGSNTGSNSGNTGQTAKPLTGTWSGTLDCASTITVDGQNPQSDTFQQALSITFDAAGRPVASPILNSKVSTQIDITQVGQAQTVTSSSANSVTTQTITVTEATYTDNFVKVVVDFTVSTTFNNGTADPADDSIQTGNGTQSYEVTVMSEQKIQYKSSSSSALVLRTAGGLAGVDSQQTVDCQGILIKQ